MQKIKIKNFIWIVIPFLALLLIFHNSMYPILQSDQQSGAILNALNRFLTAIGFQAIFTQFAVRKLAHLIEYTIFGCLFTVSIPIIWKKRNGFFFFQMFLFLAFPVMDETIQLAYPGRGSSVRDVLIDFAGCMIGTGICLVIFKSKIIGAKPFTVFTTHTKITGITKHSTKRRILTAITILFVLFIFHNSMYSGPQSGSQSRYVMNLLNHLLNVLGSPMILSEHLVRKAAHFAEYFVLGILVLITARSYRKTIRDLVFVDMFFLLLVPVIDEFIQLYTPQRGSSVLDVLLDFSGGMAGMLLFSVIFRLRQKEV